MISFLSKRDLEWRKIATKICGNKFLADDLVNDMYIKLMDKKEEVNTSYVSTTIYHLYLKHIKKEKPISNVMIEDLINYIQNTDECITSQRQELNIALDELGLIDREILLHTHEKSLRKTAEDLDMCHVKIHYKKQKALEKLLETQTVKKMKNENRRIL